MPNQLSMQPSSQDRALAKEVGFDEKALAIVKEITGSEFRKVELNNYEFEPDWSKYHVNHRPKVTAAEVESFRKMGDKYPELKTTIEKWIANFKKPATSYLRRFLFDIIAHNDQILMNLIRMVGADRVVLGDDYPFNMGLDRPVDVVERLKLSVMSTPALPSG